MICKVLSEQCLDLIDLPPLLRSFLRESFVYHGHYLIKQLTIAMPLVKLNAGSHLHTSCACRSQFLASTTKKRPMARY